MVKKYLKSAKKWRKMAKNAPKMHQKQRKSDLKINEKLELMTSTIQKINGKLELVIDITPDIEQKKDRFCLKNDLFN